MNRHASPQLQAVHRRRPLAVALGVLLVVAAAVFGWLKLTSTPDAGRAFSAVSVPPRPAEMVAALSLPRLTAAEATKADEAGILPGDVPWTGSGTMITVSGTVDAPNPERRVVNVLVRVESDLPVDPDIFATYVLATLNDPRGWGEQDNVSFARTDDPASADVTLNLSSPTTTDRFCASAGTSGYTSCGLTTSVNLNANRWVYGADAFTEAGGTLTEYHEYLVNHEFGHFLGHGHVSCPAVGTLAPTMLQQTLRLEGCISNGWPNP